MDLICLKNKNNNLSKSISAIFSANQSSLPLDLFSSKVEAGFPSPAEDFVEGQLDLNEHLIHHPAATFFVRVSGDSMIGVGIHHNDILVVDKSLEATSGSVVIATINGDFTVKTLERHGNKIQLVAANPNYPTIDVSPEMDFDIWGVVTSVIHQFKGSL